MEEIERSQKRSFANSAASVIHRASVVPSSIQDDKYIEKRGGFCFNLRNIWGFIPSTQDQLREFLCSDSDRLSTFLVKVEDSEKYKRDIQASSSPIGQAIYKEIDINNDSNVAAQHLTTSPHLKENQSISHISGGGIQTLKGHESNSLSNKDMSADILNMLHNLKSKDYAPIQEEILPDQDMV